METQKLIEEQDQHLDILSKSIGRLKNIAISIGSEVEDQNHLLDETINRVDRTQGKLDSSKRRLDYVSEKVKENKTWILICVLIVLIVILVVLVLI